MNMKTGGIESVKMTDAELSQKLGHYQKMAAVWTMVGLAGAIGGVISYFAVDDAAVRAILMALLFFGGICCAIFFGGGAQKKLKALMQSQLGDFFRTELESAFGPAPQTTEMPIDEKAIKPMGLAENQWEECQVEHFYQGLYRGMRFSAANVRLDHVYERTIPHEGLETCREMVFKGLVLRCETRISAPRSERICPSSPKPCTNWSGASTGRFPAHTGQKIAFPWLWKRTMNLLRLQAASTCGIWMQPGKAIGNPCGKWVKSWIYCGKTTAFLWARMKRTERHDAGSCNCAAGAGSGRNCRVPYLPEKKKTLRRVAVALLSVLTLTLLGYIILTLFFVGAVSGQPPGS